MADDDRLTFLTFRVVRIEVNLGKHEFGESFLDRSIAATIEALRVAEQLQSEGKVLAACVEFACCVGKLSGDFGPLRLDGGELFLDLGLGPVGVVNEIEIVVFLDVQLGQLCGEALLHVAQVGLFMLHGVCELFANLGDKVTGQANVGKVPVNGCLYLGHAKERQVAEVLLPTSAEEVEVDAAVAFAACDDHAMSAAVAPQQAFQPVGVLAFAGIATTM